MSVIISDETLLAHGMTEAQIRQEVALLLFQSGNFAQGQASK